MADVDGDETALGELDAELALVDGNEDENEDAHEDEGGAVTGGDGGAASEAGADGASDGGGNASAGAASQQVTDESGDGEVLGGVGSGTDGAGQDGGVGQKEEEEAEDEAMEYEEADKDPTFRSVEECEAILEAARAANRRRAERFGAPYKEPNKWALLTRTEIQRLRAKEDDAVRAQIAAKRGPGFVRGLDPTDEEEQKRREARAKKFGVVPAAAPAKEQAPVVPEAELVPMLTEEERQDRESRRQRAKRFGVPFEEDVAIAKAASDALGRTWTIADQKGVRPVIRKSAIHVRAREYLCASNKDLQHLFGAYGIKWVEWLNGQCVNVLFEDAASAARAMNDISEPVPRVDGVPRVHSQWRHAVKMLVKSKSDAYGPKGSLTKVYLRYATDRDVKELAKRTKGPRSMFGRRARKPKRPRAPVERSTEDRERATKAQQQRMEDLDTALDSYLSGKATSGAAAAPDTAAGGRAAKRRRRREGGSSRVVSSATLADIVGADVLAEAERSRRPQTAAEREAELDAALDAYSRSADTAKNTASAAAATGSAGAAPSADGTSVAEQTGSAASAQPAEADE